LPVAALEDARRVRLLELGGHHSPIRVARGEARSRLGCQPEPEPPMKKLLEIILCILHPIAVVLIWINLLIRRDRGFVAKLTWGIAAIVPFVPFVYVLTGNDFI
jgi:hypothetical protein